MYTAYIFFEMLERNWYNSWNEIVPAEYVTYFYQQPLQKFVHKRNQYTYEENVALSVSLLKTFCSYTVMRLS